MDQSFPAFVRWLSDIDVTGFRASLGILWDGFIRPTTYGLGAAADVPEVEATQCAACFSATRLDKLAKLIKTRSSYGVGFRQDELALAGGPVKYLKAGSAEAAELQRDIRERRRHGVDPADPFWQTTPFIELSEDNSWEEEWRVPGGFSFGPDDVAFAFLPEDLHDNAHAFFAEHRSENTGPAYLCRYIDPHWDGGRIKRVLAAPVPSTPEPVFLVPTGFSPFGLVRRR